MSEPFVRGASLLGSSPAVQITVRLKVRLETPFCVADRGMTLNDFLSKLLGVTTGFAGNALPKLLLNMGLIQFPVYLARFFLARQSA